MRVRRRINNLGVVILLQTLFFYSIAEPLYINCIALKYKGSALYLIYYCSSISLSSLSLHRYFLVSCTSMPLRNRSDRRFGIAMSAFMQSAMFQTIFRLAMLPTYTATIYSRRYTYDHFFPFRYSTALSP